MNDPKLTMNGMRASASETFDTAGDPKTGSTSSINSTFGAAPATISLSGRVGVCTPCAVEQHAAGLIHAAGHAIERVDGDRVEQPVGVRERGAADDRHRQSVRGEFACQPLDLCRGHPGALLHFLRREWRGCRYPARRPAAPRSPARCPVPAHRRCLACTATNSSALAAVCDSRAST